jgi:hypothetical protein
VSPVRYKLGFYIPEDDILHSYSREILRCYMDVVLSRARCGVTYKAVDSDLKLDLFAFLATTTNYYNLTFNLQQLCTCI